MERATCIDKVNHKHLVLMELMLVRPDLTKEELADLLRYDYQYLCNLVQDPVFKDKFEAYQEGHMEKVSDAIVELEVQAKKATVVALDKSVEIMNETDPEKVTVAAKQKTISEILNQGHAKAVERRADLHLTGELPKGALEGLLAVAKELSQPFEPKRLLQKPAEGEVVDAEAS